MENRVQWTAMTYYDQGKLGYTGCCSSSGTEKQALIDAKKWLSEHFFEHNWWYMKPSSVITIGIQSRNWITGERIRMDRDGVHIL